MRAPPDGPRDFVREIVDRHQAEGTYGGRVVTRFPPEPNGYLHIGHAKSIHLNFGLARDYGGVCHLRMDDTNPTTEDPEYVEAIQRDVRWLGFDWGDRFFHAADYFEPLYQYAVELIRRGKAYVCSLSEAEMREYRGTVTEPGRPSPYRDRSIEESLDLFARMRAGEFGDGAHTLRARIDMASPNMKLRDPPLYRIRRAAHYRTGEAWCIYPLYDWAHCLSDSIEGITHSICTLEFENNRDLYDWFLDALPVPQPRPRQYEFARLVLTYTVMSKRKLLALVESGLVSGWDDPRMPTLSGLRRRGYTPEGIRAFCETIGVSKHNSFVEVGLLESCIRDDLNRRAPRLMAVLDPLPVSLSGLAAPLAIEAPWFPADVDAPVWEGPPTRALTLGAEILVERDDWADEPPPGWHRLAPGAVVRLRHGPVVRCERAERDAQGRVTRLHCAVLDEGAPRPRGTLHWVDAAQAVTAEVRLYERLFNVEHPDRAPGDFKDHLNPHSLTVLDGCRLEPAAAGFVAGAQVQFERHGFFAVDPDARPGRPVFNLTVALRDTWARKASAAGAAVGAPKAAPRPRSPEAEAVRAPLPAEAEALVTAHALGEEEARVLAAQPALREVFSGALAAGAPAVALAVLLVHEVARELRSVEPGAAPPSAAALVELLALQATGELSAAQLRQVLAVVVREGGAPRAVAAQLGLQRLDAEAATDAIDAALAELGPLIERFRAGETKLMGVLVGEVMRRTAGRLDGKQVQAALRSRLQG